MKKLTLFITVLCLSSVIQAQTSELSFEETLSYIQDKIRGSVYKSDGFNYELKDRNFEHKNSCVFIYSHYNYATNNNNQWSAKQEYKFDLSGASIKIDHYYIRFGKESREISYTKTYRSGRTINDSKWSFQLKIENETDRERLLKAFKHLQSLCPKDPFD